MIRIPDPELIGVALAEVRAMLGVGRNELARAVADLTGRNPKSVASQLSQWARLENGPTFRSVGPVLVALDLDLALVPREEA